MELYTLILFHNLQGLKQRENVHVQYVVQEQYLDIQEGYERRCTMSLNIFTIRTIGIELQK